jgi:ATP-dependent RNA helicase RhlE
MYKQRNWSYGQNRNGGSSRYGRRQSTIPQELLVNKADLREVEDAYVPKHTFNDFNLHDSLKRNIVSKKYVNPTPIQDQAIPEIMAGRDVVGIANTGTGKTAAYLIPTINKIASLKKSRVLIVTPTRELALQIEEEAREFSRDMHMYVQTCIGGVGIYYQIKRLHNRPEIVIGTPGRLLDLYDRNVLHFDEYETVILDEVDTMLDMGFIHDVRTIINELPVERQSLFFSATLTPKVKSVMQAFLDNPITIMTKTAPTSAAIDQDVVRVAGRAKQQVLHELLIQESFEKVIVFGNSKFGIERLARDLVVKGHRVATLHGNKSQGQRTRALDEFRSNRVKVLLATDVASRGLDITDVTHVINYDLPKTYEDYIHRIGRTGRANNTGSAISFVE